MSYSLYRELIALTEEFEAEFPNDQNIDSFSVWLHRKTAVADFQPEWEGKSSGRSPDSVINTSIVHLYRYAKLYSKVAIANSPFTSIDDVIFLLNLLHKGSMTKIKLIDLNLHEKSTGLQIISRLLKNDFISELSNENDRRSKKIEITEKGKNALNEIMDRIRHASFIVTGNLTLKEKHELITLLQKLEDFHVEKFDDLIRF